MICSSAGPSPPPPPPTFFFLHIPHNWLRVSTHYLLRQFVASLWYAFKKTKSYNLSSCDKIIDHAVLNVKWRVTWLWVTYDAMGWRTTWAFNSCVITCYLVLYEPGGTRVSILIIGSRNRAVFLVTASYNYRQTKQAKEYFQHYSPRLHFSSLQLPLD